MFLDLSILRFNKNFRLLFAAQVISSFGSQMTMVTIPFQVYSITNSIFLTGLVGSVELLALGLTVLIGGVLSDRLNRKHIMIA
ncbi:MAG: MFS transporter [Deltaproteobacteria bacterium]|nr:MFS transporter [Deltaproteobacteria bacterium]